jgi:hypothetical protein
MSLLGVVLLASLALLGACGGGQPAADRPAAETAAPPTGAGHAEAGVVPGSYEDWCAEHAVPETQCTRCNPALVAAFQATGDWCAEHGLPESQCLACNPGLVIVRPPKPAGAAETPGL